MPTRSKTINIHTHRHLIPTPQRRLIHTQLCHLRTVTHFTFAHNDNWCTRNNDTALTTNDVLYAQRRLLHLLTVPPDTRTTNTPYTHTKWSLIHRVTYLHTMPPIPARQRRFIGTVTACTFTRNSALYPHKTPYTRRDAFYIYTSLFRVHQVALYANVKCVTVCRWHRCVCIRRPCGVGIRWRCVWMLMVLLCVGNGFVCK